MKTIKTKTTLLSTVLFALMSMLCVTGCTKKKEGKVTITTKSVVEITANSAKSGGNVTATDNASVGMCGICWSENPSPTTNNFITTDIVGLGEYISAMNNLKPSTKYYVRAYTTLSSGEVMYGEEKNFTTLSDSGGNSGSEGIITVSTNDATEITSSSATCGGNVTVTGEVTITARGICYGTSHTPTIENAHTSDSQGAGSFASHLTNLSENTTYYVRAYAQTASEVVYGGEVNFTTLTAVHSAIQVTDVTHNSVKIEITPAPDVVYYYSKIVGTGNAERHEASETTLTFNSLTPETQYNFEFTFYGSSDNLLDTKTTSATTSEQPYVAPTVTVTLVNVSPTFLELKFEPSSNTSYYCYNIGGSLTSTTHVTGVKTQKFTNLQSDYMQPDTEYEFSVVAYDANGTAGEIMHPKFKTNPAPYSNYMRIFDNFYQLNYAKLVNQPLNNYRTKEIQIWSEPGYWVRFFTVVYSYVTDNVWDSGVYTTTTSGNVGVGQYGWSMVKNGNWWGEGICRFTIKKSGNTYTYDLYGNRGEYTAHFTGIPTQ